MTDSSLAINNAPPGSPTLQKTDDSGPAATITATTAAALSLAEKRAFLRRVVETPAGAAGAEDSICQEIVRTRRVKGRGEAAEEWETERIKLPDKLKAIQIDNELAKKDSEDGPKQMTLLEIMKEITAVKK